MNADYILRYLDDTETDIFNLTDLANALGQMVHTIQSNIETLVKKQLFNRIEKGKYCRHNFRNENVIANYLAPEGAVAYWSALNLHGLTSQFTNTVFVQTPKLKKNKTVFGVTYHFIKVKQAKATGYEKSGIGNHTFTLTSVEKTIVDCFDLPEYSGGYAELLLALNKTKLNNTKLIEACRSINNIAATKRIGYLVEFYQIKGMQSFINYALSCVNEKYNTLDPSGKNEGSFNTRWKLRLNISKEQLLAMSENLT